ncbi:extracellular solute-binding protein [Natronosporangium hydrolyticum]|uniref:Extracellular solute-binding protein n=1 Tax=Natronosporangium hydrolyticum TaxID=2811111 RepID=A0A895Y9E5_9ACTN|nr:extracellular solute-binding protein [Natronosporangium hydrolyticum]QSB12935.1 extracellular solute-binding protein [Natronosporangium hydrolyticum]
MRQKIYGPVVLVAALALTSCGSATGSGTSSGGATDTLVVWDWKSGDASAAAYLEQARADFAEQHPDTTVEFVAQPFDQYYTLLGAAIQAGEGPDVIMFNGGGQLRDRTGALVPLDDYVADDQQRLAGWEAFSDDGEIYAAPVTLQGHPVYYNKGLYEQAGLDPEQPAATWDEFLDNCATIEDATGAHCFAMGNQEGSGIQFFMSGMGPSILTPAEYDAWIEGERDWQAPNVRQIFELWTEVETTGLNNPGVNSTTMFTDMFAIFEAGEAAHVIGLMSDIGHWKDFNEFLGEDAVGVMDPPIVTDGAAPLLPYDGGIGYGVARWTADPALAADLVRSLTSTDALTAFYLESGAIASDTSIDTSGSGAAAGTLVAQLETGKPALHVALSSATQELMGRLSQQLLSDSVTVDEALEQLAASDQAE